MLDLNNIYDNLYQIKTVEGDIVELKKPSQELLNKMIAVQEFSADNLKSINYLYELFRDILNLNINGKTFDDKYVSQFDIQTISLVITDYMNHTFEQLGE